MYFKSTLDSQIDRYFFVEKKPFLKVTEKILFFFSALGVFNAGLASLYFLLFKRDRAPQDFLLGILLLCLFLRVGISCFNFFGPMPYGAIKLGLIANLLLGPTTLFLMMKDGPKAKREFLFHFGFWLVLLGSAWALLDFHIWDWKLRFVIHAALTAYLVAAGFVARKDLLGVFSRKSSSRSVIVYWSVVLICTGSAVSLVTNYILGPLIFSTIFYLATGYVLLGQKKLRKEPTRQIDEELSSQISQKLQQLMEEDKVYRDPELSLEILAEKLSVSKHMLSQVLNDYLQRGFHQYVNDHRIREACVMLKEQKHFSIEAIGHEVGFHSRSSFFSSFKKSVGMTPSKYRAAE